MPSNLANAPTPPARSMALLSSSIDGRYHDRVRCVNTNVFDDAGIKGRMDTLPSRLVTARDLRKLTQTQLAKLAGVSQSTIGNIEAGIRDGGSSLASIAHALRVSYFWLRDGDGAMELPRHQPDAEAVAEAFDALPVDSEMELTRRQWLYQSIMAQIAEAQREARANAPALAPGVLPTAAHLRRQ